MKPMTFTSCPRCIDISNIFGDTSPIGKLYNLDGKVLLIGVGYDKNTSIHLADVRAEYPGKHTCVEHSAVMENGKRVWKAYETLFVDGEDFKATPHNSARADPEKIWVLIKALFRRCTLCTSRKK